MLPFFRDVADHLRRVAEDFERLGDELSHSPHSKPYEAVLKLAVERVPAARAASITTVEHDRFVTAAATSRPTTAGPSTAAGWLRSWACAACCPTG